MKLQEKAILVSLTIKRWHGTKFDKKTTQEIDRQNKAKNAGRYTKYLIAKRGMERITTMESRIRNYHYKMTYPWGDNKDRLLPNSKYFEYMSEMRKLKQEFFEVVEDLIIEFPSLQAEAKIKLNGLYNEKEYPATEELKKRFDVKISPLPIQTSDDFRTQLHDDEVEQIKQEAEAEIRDRQLGVMKDVFTRIEEATQRMEEKLTEGGTFRNTLVSNIESQLLIASELNVTDDRQINNLIEEAKQLLVSPDLLRSSTRKRQETAQRAKDLSDKLAIFNLGD